MPQLVPIFSAIVGGIVSAATAIGAGLATLFGTTIGTALLQIGSPIGAKFDQMPKGGES